MRAVYGRGERPRRETMMKKIGSNGRRESVMKRRRRMRINGMRKKANRMPRRRRKLPRIPKEVTKRINVSHIMERKCKCKGKGVKEV